MHCQQRIKVKLDTCGKLLSINVPVDAASTDILHVSFTWVDNEERIHSKHKHKHKIAFPCTKLYYRDKSIRSVGRPSTCTTERLCTTKNA